MSPLLKLPAELRIHIYELVLGGQFIHVEAGRRRSCCTPRPFSDAALARFEACETDKLKDWARKRCLHFYLCQATISEEEAYRRSRDAETDERIQEDSELLGNHWRLGDSFHIDSCRRRHDECCPRPKNDDMPSWMFTPRDQVQRDRTISTQLDQVLSLNLLKTCSQVHQEAKDIPFSANTFGFVNVLALLWFSTQLTVAQSTSLRSTWLFWRAGNSSHASDGQQWNHWLFAPPLLHRLQGLRVLHLSVSIVHATMGDKGPVRADVHGDGSLHKWFIGLKLLRQLPLERATVIISDEPSSNFGIDGYADRYHRIGWNSLYEAWLDMREDECLTAEEKRQWAERIRSHLLKLTPNHTLQRIHVAAKPEA